MFSTPNFKSKQATNDTIQKKLALIEECKSTIKLLSDQLVASQERLHQLETELSRHRAVIAPIRRVPADVLTIIFKQYTLEKPTHIRRLLLVCRFWHELAMNTRALWSYIDISGQIDALRAKRLIPYVKACVRRSGEVLLDVCFDLTYFVDPWTFAEDAMRAALSELREETEVDTIVDREDFDKSAVSHACADSFFGLFTTLTGNNGENAQRWRSFTVRWEDDLGYAIFYRIFAECRHPTPNLEVLALEGLMWVFDDSLRIGNVCYFPDLRSLKTLNLHQMDVDLKKINPSPLVIETLCMRACDFESHDNITPLSSYQNLRFLELSAPFLQSPLDTVPQEIVLARVSMLTLREEFTHPFLFCLAVPKLETLLLLDFYSLTVSASLFTRPHTVTIGITTTSVSVTKMQFMIRQMLLNCTSAIRIASPKQFRQFTVSTLAELLDRTQISPSLQTVSFGDGIDSEEIVHVQTKD